PLVVVRLELVRLAVERLEVPDPVVAGTGREDLVEGQRAENGEPSGAPAPDQQRTRVDPALSGGEARAGDAVFDVGDTPCPIERAGVVASVPAAARVVDVEHRKAPAGPELDDEVESALRRRRRAAMTADDEGWPRARRPLVVRALWPIQGAVRGASAGAGERDRLRQRDRGRIDRYAAGPAERGAGPAGHGQGDH